jgi:very-short-patch-repair endonuclease
LGNQLLGLGFRRQYSSGTFVINFYRSVLKLAVKIDEDSHFLDGPEAADQRREAYISGFGIRFLRFTNEEIYRSIVEVL